MGSRASERIRGWLHGDDGGPRRTQKELAIRLSAHVKRDVCQSTISNFLSGKSKPHADLMLALKAECGIEVEWWVEQAPLRTGTDG